MVNESMPSMEAEDSTSECAFATRAEKQKTDKEGPRLEMDPTYKVHAEDVRDGQQPFADQYDSTEITNGNSHASGNHPINLGKNRTGPVRDLRLNSNENTGLRSSQSVHQTAVAQLVKEGQ